MIQRYTNPEMGAIWSEQRRYESWLEVELAAADAMAAAGIIPAEEAKELRARAAFDVARIEEIEQITHHDVIAFTTAVAEKVGPAARWLHFGLTSYDVVDTAQALQMRQACDLSSVVSPVRWIGPRSRRGAPATPMIGRTHGVHAEPMTFGLKLALWYAGCSVDLDRLIRARDIIAVGKISGAVGTFAHLDPSIEAAVCERLGLQAAPVSSQVDSRAPRRADDRDGDHGGVPRGSLRSRSAACRRRRSAKSRAICQRAEGLLGDAAQTQSIGCEQITGLARLIRAKCDGGPREHRAVARAGHLAFVGGTRDPARRFIALDHMPGGFTRIAAGMVVYPDRMRENLERSRGVVFSGTILLELARRGISREQAYEWVQRNAMRSFHEQKDFKELLLADADVVKVLPPAEIEKAFDLDDQLRNVDAIFARVFATAVS